MIAFGSAVTKPDVYAANAEPGFRRVAEADSEIYALPSQGSIFHNYNRLLDHFAPREDLEAVVLVHQDAELVDADFCQRIRRALAYPDVGVAGCVGAIGVRSIAWWEGSLTLASFVHRYPELGGGDMPGFSWDWSTAPPYARVGEVETLDGFVLVISPWVARNVRFDENLGQFHGYDFDFCLQVRASGRKVVTADFRAIHNHALQPFDDPEPWIDAHTKVAEKWDGRLPGVGHDCGTWEERARRAAAERDVARVTRYDNELKLAARIRELEAALADAHGSLSWRLTSPLRRLGGLRPAPPRPQYPARAQ